MTLTRRLSRAPAFVRRWALHFECAIEDAVVDFAKVLPAHSRVLDAGAGEGRYRAAFTQHRYIGVDLAIGDAGWNYSGLDVLADLTALPFRDACFDAALNIVTLEHVRDPRRALREISRLLLPGASMLLIVPLEWEEHQAPHDYFRYTRYGLRWLLEDAGLDSICIHPSGGFFRLLSRRMLNGLQFFTRGWGWLLFLPAAVTLVSLSLLFPLFEGLDAERKFTLGYICTARKR